MSTDPPPRPAPSLDRAPPAPTEQRELPASGPRQRWKHSLSLVWVTVLLTSGVVFGWTHRNELDTLTRLLRDSNPWWLLLGAVAVPIGLSVTTRLYQRILARLENALRFVAVLEAYLRGFVAGAVVPLGGPTWLAVFTSALHAYGTAVDDALLAAALGSLAGYASFMLLLAPALLILWLDQGIPDTILYASGAVTLLFGLSGALLGYVLRGPPLPRALYRRLPEVARSFISHGRDHHLTLRDLARPTLLSLADDLAGAVMLYAAVHAIDQHVSVAAVLVVAELAMLLTVASPLFQGLGVVEVSVTVALGQFGVPQVSALAATLVYRVFTLWAPLALAVVVEALRLTGRLLARLLHRAS